MATAGLIATGASSSTSPDLPLGPSVRAFFYDPVPSISVRKT
jgi:hypothetical protein